MGRRLTPDGHDVLAYRAARSAASTEGPPTATLGPGLREVELRPAEMRALRIYLSLHEHLRRPAAEGLAEAACTARFMEGFNRWVLHVSDHQLASIARACFLEGLTGQVTAANRIARTYGAMYKPY